MAYSLEALIGPALGPLPGLPPLTVVALPLADSDGAGRGRPGAWEAGVPAGRRHGCGGWAEVYVEPSSSAGGRTD
jgi:hypothetical protein